MDKYSKRYGKALVQMMMYKNNYLKKYNFLDRFLYLPYFYYCKITYKFAKRFL